MSNDNGSVNIRVRVPVDVEQAFIVGRNGTFHFTGLNTAPTVAEAWIPRREGE